MSVFAWGLGKSGQLGDGRRETSELPRRVDVRSAEDARGGAAGESRETAAWVGAGGLYTAVLTKAGGLYVCGSGGHGRLGTGSEQDVDTLTQLTSLKQLTLTTVSCGIWHGATITDSGQIFIWGYKSHGVLGVLVHGPFAPPTLVTPLSSTKVLGVSCGNNFTVAWDFNGALYSWGCGRHGVLGHGDEEDRHEPTRIQNLVGRFITKADAGFVHCGTLTEQGVLFMFGLAKFGALGIGPTKQKSCSNPRQTSAPPGVKFVDVSCSKGEHHGHTLVASATGQVYAWGDGYKGKLGTGSHDTQYSPVSIPTEAFNGEKIIQVSAGGIHSAAVGANGQLFTWGCGSDGRLGHPEAKGHRYLFRSDVPRLVEELAGKWSALRVSTSYYHTVVLAEPMKQKVTSVST